MKENFHITEKIENIKQKNPNSNLVWNLDFHPEISGLKFSNIIRRRNQHK